MPWGSEVTRVFKQNLNTSSLIWYINQVTRPQRYYLMLVLWVVTLMQGFAESRNAYLCFMLGSVSNFADFQFWPYCLSLNCSKFCYSPPFPWKGCKLSLRVFLFIQHQVHTKKFPRTKMVVHKESHFFTFSKIWSFCTISLLILSPWGSDVTRVLKQNLNIHSLIWYLNQVTKPKKNYLLPLLLVVTFMQVFAESCYAYLCIMQGFVSNFANFQFWPYCPSLNCS